MTVTPRTHPAGRHVVDAAWSLADLTTGDVTLWEWWPLLMPWRPAQRALRKRLA